MSACNKNKSLETRRQSSAREPQRAVHADEAFIFM